MLTKQDREDIKDIVVEVIHEVVMPAFETITESTKQDLNHLEERLDEKISSVQTRVDQIDRKLDIFSAKTSEHEVKLLNHSKRIEKLESKKVIVV